MKYTFSISTKGNSDIIDITNKVQDIIQKSKVDSGIVNVFVIGSTAGITTIEYEPGLVKDLALAFDKIAPYGEHYHHHDLFRQPGNRISSRIPNFPAAQHVDILCKEPPFNGFYRHTGRRISHRRTPDKIPGRGGSVGEILCVYENRAQKERAGAG